MKKSLLLGIVISSAFLIGIFSANPVVEAVGGWQGAIENLTIELNPANSNVIIPDQIGQPFTIGCPEGTVMTGWIRFINESTFLVEYTPICTPLSITSP